MEHTLVSINGNLVNSSNAHISVFDRGFLFGDSIYEATMLKDGIPIFWQEHMMRLYKSANLIHLPLSINPKTLEKWIEQLIGNFKHPQGLLRLVITRGEGAVNIYPSHQTQNNIVLYLAPLKYPKTWYDIGLKYFISSIERNSIKALNPKAKTGNYLNSQLALMEAKKSCFDDSLMINANGYITEGTTNNFWFVKGDTIFTADSQQGILEGITRDKIINLIHQLGYKLQLGAWRIDQALKADEAFMTSATKGVVPIVALSQWKIGSGLPGVITKNLHTEYEKLVADYIQKAQWKSL
jgi:branched-chain amino acid aminotransferase